MSLNLKYPGVYIQELPSGVHPIMGVSTSLTAFVGEASFGPVNEPTLINSFADFERIFGGLDSGLNLGYAVSHYFANGGQQAIVVRVVGKNARKAQFRITDTTGTNALTLQAKNEGKWANTAVDNAGQITQFVDSGLTNGMEYSYTITAVNSAGESPDSNEASDSPSAPAAPQQPQNPLAIGGFGQITLSWQPPGSNGGATITAYNIYRDTTKGAELKPGAQVYKTVDASVTNYTDLNLANGTPYYYSVTAVNSAGESPDSNEASDTPSASITKPLNLKATPGNNQITLSWQPPGSNGGATITAYNIYRDTTKGAELKPGAQVYKTVDASVTNYTDLNLANGTPYYYSVTAVNSTNAESPDSDEASDTPSAPAAPQQPQNPLAIGGFGQITLSWQPPASNGGASISSYNIYRSTAAGGEVDAKGNPKAPSLATVNGSTTNYTDLRLANDTTTYYYIVTAVNSAGGSPPSTEASAMPTAKLTKPMGLTATPGDGQITLSWQPPASNGGASISCYVIYRSTSANNTVITLVGKVVGGLNIVADNNTKNPQDSSLFNLSITNATSGAKEVFLNLSTSKTDPQYVGKILENDSNLLNLVNDSPASIQFNPIPPSSFGSIPAVMISAGVDDPATATEVLGDENAKTGMYALKNADIFNLLCIPPYGVQADNISPNTDIDYTDILKDVVTFCNERRAIFLVDSPTKWESPTKQVSDIQLSDLGSISFRENAAIYFPRVNMADQLNQGRMREFVPCGAIAGTIARIDGQRGVWKAPAGIDATVGGVISLSYPLTDGDNGVLNPQGINCLRSFPEIGSIIWGSRTLKGADILADQWKYLPIRRLALYIEESLRRGTQWVVFEPNDEPLWSQIRLNVGSFMQDLFRKGAFQGSTPKEAYFVRCDSTTTTSDDQDKGIVNILVGFAPLKPAEFVVIQIQQIAGQGAGG